MAPAVVATAVALAGINFGLAVLIVAAIGARTFAPTWLGVAGLAFGVVSAGVAVVLWQRYLAARRVG
jgi:hypothetical protein